MEKGRNHPPFFPLSERKSDPDAAEDKVDVLEVVVEGETGFQLIDGKEAHHVRGLLQQSLIVKTFGPGFHRDGLHGVVCLLARQTLADEGVHHTLGEDDALSAVDVRKHRLGIDHEILEDALKAGQHVVQQLGGVRENDALG